MPPSAPFRDAGAEFRRAKDRRFLAKFRQYWWLVLLLTALFAFGGALWLYFQSPSYLSAARMVVNGKITVPGGATYSEELSNFYGTQVELMQSEEVRRRAAERVATASPELSPVPVALVVHRTPESSIFVLTAVGRDAVYTQKYLDAILVEYTAVKKQMRADLSDDELSSITVALQRLDAEINQGEAELIEFQKDNNVGFLQEQGNSAAEYLVTLNRSLANLKNEYQLLQTVELDSTLDRDQKHRVMMLAQKDRAAATAAGKTETGTLDEVKKETADDTRTSSDAEVTDLAKLQADLNSLLAQRRELAKIYLPAHPSMVEIDAKIADQKRVLDALGSHGVDELAIRRDSLRLEIANLEKTIKEWEVKAVDVGKRMADYNRIKEKVDRAREINQQQVSNLRNIDLSKNVDQDSVSILEHASAALPVPLPVARALSLACTAGLVAGLLAVLFLNKWDNRLLFVQELELHFPDRLLAQIPVVPNLRRGKNAVDLLVENDQRHAFAESLRSLRSSLVFLPMDGAAPRSILVTSAVPNEGKSVIAANLAVTFAFAGARTLLIDGDLRRGTLHEQFGLANKSGFSDVLQSSDPQQWRAALQRTQTQNLTLLSRGGLIHHPGEHFLRRATDRLLGELYGEFDYVILDTAPVMVADDTTSLAPKIDATLFVVRYGFSVIRTSFKALELLRARQANILGLVCNDVEISAQEYNYYGYPEYYGTAAASET